MSAFDEREKSFEAKYHLDGELAFKVIARRNKLLGLWVAERLGLSGAESETYARSLIDAALAESDHKGMIRKLHADLSSKQSDISEERLQMKLEKFYGIAYQEILQEVNGGKRPE